LASFAKQLLANFWQVLQNLQTRTRSVPIRALGARWRKRTGRIRNRANDLPFLYKHLPCLKEENATEKRKGGRLAAER
jgi:hypothetical protein